MQKREQNKIKERIIYKGGKEMRRNKSGISLIVLVITIIVMIILASAIIISLSNTDILSKANTAVDANNEKEVQNLASLLWSEAYIEYMSETNETTKVANIQSYIDGKLTDDIKAKYDVTATINGVTVAKKGAGTNPDSGNTNTPGASTIGALITGPSDYGKTVVYSANGVSDWQVLYEDTINGYVFITTKGLVEPITPTTVEVSSLGTKLDLYKKFQVGTWDKYTLVDEITDPGGSKVTHGAAQLVAGLIANYGSYASAEYGDNVIGAIGSPTVELIIAGWNERHNAYTKTLSINQYGYQIDGSIAIPLDVEDTLYKLNYNYDLASPAAPPPLQAYALEMENANIISPGSDGIEKVRPVVCLKASTPAKATADGYELLK